MCLWAHPPAATIPASALPELEWARHLDGMQPLKRPINLTGQMTRSTFGSVLMLLTSALSACALACVFVSVEAAAPIPQAGTPAPPAPAVSVTSVSPPIAAAIVPGGVGFPVELTVTGKNFRPGASVKLGKRDGGVVSVSDTRILVTTPGESAGIVDVTVVNPDGTSATLLKGFTYTTGPIVYAISPKTGSAMMPTVITINGANLTGDSVVTVGEQPAPISLFFSSTSLEVQAPANTAVPAGGTASGAITVKNPDGQTFTLPNAFTWSNRPDTAPSPPASPSPAASPSPVSRSTTGQASAGAS